MGPQTAEGVEAVREIASQPGPDTLSSTVEIVELTGAGRQVRDHRPSCSALGRDERARLTRRTLKAVFHARRARARDAGRARPEASRQTEINITRSRIRHHLRRESDEHLRHPEAQRMEVLRKTWRKPRGARARWVTRRCPIRFGGSARTSSRRTVAQSAPSASTRRRALRRSGSTPVVPCCRSTRSSRSPTR